MYVTYQCDLSSISGLSSLSIYISSLSGSLTRLNTISWSFSYFSRNCSTDIPFGVCFANFLPLVQVILTKTPKFFYREPTVQHILPSSLSLSTIPIPIPSAFTGKSCPIVKEVISIPKWCIHCYYTVLKII